MVGIVAVGAIVNALFWGTPLAMAIYYLRNNRVRSLLT
jgi:hypothetical protein